MPILIKLLQKIEEERTLPNLFLQSQCHQYKNQTETIQKKENYRPMSLMNIDAKILNKILANGIQQHIKKTNL